MLELMYPELQKVFILTDDMEFARFSLHRWMLNVISVPDEDEVDSEDSLTSTADYRTCDILIICTSNPDRWINKVSVTLLIIEFK